MSIHSDMKKGGMPWAGRFRPSIILYWCYGITALICGTLTGLRYTGVAIRSFNLESTAQRHSHRPAIVQSSLTSETVWPPAPHPWHSKSQPQY